MSGYQVCYNIGQTISMHTVRNWTKGTRTNVCSLLNNFWAFPDRFRNDLANNQPKTNKLWRILNKSVAFFIIAPLVFQVQEHSMFDEINMIRFSLCNVYSILTVSRFYFTLLNSDYVPNKYQICVMDILLSYFYR